MCSVRFSSSTCTSCDRRRYNHWCCNGRIISFFIIIYKTFKMKETINTWKFIVLKDEQMWNEQVYWKIKFICMTKFPEIESKSKIKHETNCKKLGELGWCFIRHSSSSSISNAHHAAQDKLKSKMQMAIKGFVVIFEKHTSMTKCLVKEAAYEIKVMFSLFCLPVRMHGGFEGFG